MAQTGNLPEGERHDRVDTSAHSSCVVRTSLQSSFCAKRKTNFHKHVERGSHSLIPHLLDATALSLLHRLQSVVYRTPQDYSMLRKRSPCNPETESHLSFQPGASLGDAPTIVSNISCVSRTQECRARGLRQRISIETRIIFIPKHDYARNTPQ